MSWAWDLPFSGNRFVEGWQISGIGTFQSGRPFTVFDGDFSGVLFASTDPRPDLAPGATHEDQTTTGSVTSRIDNYLNRTRSRARERGSAIWAGTRSSDRPAARST